MKREEKIMTGTDRARILTDVDNLRTQLQLLRQHDWQRHLPRITLINDKNDINELTQKRKLTETEIERLLKKFSNWEQRNNWLQEDVRAFEGDSDSIDEEEDLEEDEDEDDDEESILTKPIEELQAKLLEKRRERDGFPIRICLRNGFDLVAGPYQYPRIVLSDTYTRGVPDAFL